MNAALKGAQAEKREKEEKKKERKIDASKKKRKFLRTVQILIGKKKDVKEMKHKKVRKLTKT